MIEICMYVLLMLFIKPKSTVFFPCTLFDKKKDLLKI